MNISPIDDLPPWVVKLMAVEQSPKSGLRRVTLAVMIKRGKIKKRTFQRIAASESFDNFKYKDIRKFFTALDVDPNNVEAIAQFFQSYGKQALTLKPSSWVNGRSDPRSEKMRRRLLKLDERFRKKMEGKL